MNPRPCNSLSRLKGIETRNYAFGASTISDLRSAFPFEGNWNLSALVIDAGTWSILAIRFPVWRELKLVEYKPPVENKRLACDTLSRLKGMETFVQLFLQPFFRYNLRSAFPFEGNGNYFIHEFLHLSLQLTIRFPVWRELKLKSGSNAAILPAAYDPLSRLKGIETRKNMAAVDSRLFSLAIHFPVWREWKHDTCINFGIIGYTCNSLSRLKGIETRSDSALVRACECKLAIHFPVWRELKQCRVCANAARVFWLAIHFPVWREWKRNTHFTESLPIPNLQFTFPFEGNGNWLDLTLVPIMSGSCDRRSRLKGMETIYPSDRKLVAQTFRLCFFSMYAILYLSSLGGTTKRTARYVCHPPTFVGDKWTGLEKSMERQGLSENHPAFVSRGKRRFWQHDDWS